MLLTDIIGQEGAIQRLQRALSQARVPHAYLFEGPDGVGKRSTAKALGLALLCPEQPGVGCGRCTTCHRAETGLHPDLRSFAPAGREMKKDEADEIVALAAERPHEANARLIIVDDADRLNPNAANCLLKTLEEPAAGNHVVLVSAAPARLLETILSRTQRVRFMALRAPQIVQRLGTLGVASQRAEIAAALANGSLAQAIALAEGDEEQDLWGGVAGIRNAAAGRSVGQIMDASAQFAGKDARQMLVATLALLNRLYRDAVVTATGATELVELTSKQAEIDDVLDRAGPSPIPKIRKALDALAEADEALAGNVNAVTAVEALIFSLRGLEFRRNKAGAGA